MCKIGSQAVGRLGLARVRRLVAELQLVPADNDWVGVLGKCEGSLRSSNDGRERLKPIVNRSSIDRDLGWPCLVLFARTTRWCLPLPNVR